MTADAGTRSREWFDSALPWIVFGTSLVVLVACAAGRDPWRTDEHRYIEVARQMLSGGGWLVPKLNGMPYSHKPPGFFWLIALAHRSGAPLWLAGMLPSVIGASTTLALTFAWARNGFGKPTAWTAIAILASTQLFASLSLRANIDALLTAFTTASLYGIWRGLAVRNEPGPRFSPWFMAAGLAAGLGVLVKGPVALVVPASTLAALVLFERPRPRVPATGVASLLLGAAIPSLLWLGLAAFDAGPAYVGRLVWGHGIGHALGQVDKVRPWWFYAKDFPGSLLPWTLLLPALAVWLRTEHRNRATVFALASLVAPLVVMSFFPAKRHLYLLPLCPAAAVLTAHLCHAARPATKAFAISWDLGRCLLGIIGSLLGLGLVVASLLVWGGWDRVFASVWSPWELLGGSVANGTIPFFAFVAGVLLLIGGRQVIDQNSSIWEARGIRTIGLGTALFLLGVLHPIESLGRSPLDFYRRIDALVGSDDLAFYGSSDFAPNWILKRDKVTMWPNEKSVRDFLETNPAPGWLIAEATSLMRLGTPDAAEFVVSVPRALEPPMVLLRQNSAHRRSTDQTRSHTGR